MPGRTIARLVASIAVCGWMCVAANAAVIYVNAAAAGSNNGTSWADAFTSLQSALAVAGNGDDVWVAAATYKPSTGSDRTATFTIPSGAGVYGGFAGTETLRSQRDPAAHVTILSGEIGAPGSADNSYHVVSATGVASSTTLDGFTITGGNANSVSAPDEHAGGIKLDAASINIAHCIISGNHASSYAGGLGAAGGEPTISFSTISNNTVTDSGGLGGGAVFSAGGGSISDSRISGNASTSAGGGVAAGGSVRITRCVIENNSNGGGVDLTGSAVLESSVIRGNTGFSYGGAAVSGSSRMANCLVTANNQNSGFASASGVGLSTGGTLVNDTIADNAGAGPQVYGFSGTMTNCIVVATGAGQAIGPAFGAITITYSDTFPDGYSGAGNLSVDPQLGNDYRLRSTSACIDAGDNSALDGTMTFDLSAKPRRVDVPAVPDTGAGSAPIVDMGSDEYSPSTVNVYAIGVGAGTVTSSPPGISCAPTCIATFAPGTTVTLTASPSAGTQFNGWEGDCSGLDPCVVTSPANVTARFGRVWFVKQSAAGSNNGTGWANAFNDLQSALAVAYEGDDVWVAAATYKPSSGSDRAVSFKMRSGAGVYGGFAGTEALRSQRDAAAHVTVLSGDIGAAGSADNSYHVVTAFVTAANTTLDGFTITGGNADSSGDNDSGNGAGIHLDTAALDVAHCVITGNTANQNAGGIWGGGKLKVSFSTISNNTAAQVGGIVLGAGSISDSTISGNVDTGQAGGLSAGGTARITRCVLKNNHGGVGGASLAGGLLENSLITGNTVSDPDSGNPSGVGFFGGTLVNDTIVDNPGSTPQVAGDFGSLTNCIVVSPGPGPTIAGSATVMYSDVVPGGYDGTGNISADPQFMDPANGNYRIHETSACVDAGDNSALDAAMTTDLAGKPRLVDVAGVPDTGAGTAPIVDIGADEVFPITFNGLETFNVCAGSSHTFTSGAAGYGALTYQWRKNTQPMAGETGPSLTINSAAAGDDADYDVIVTDSLGAQATSPEVHLQVSAGAPVINTQPSNVTACATAMMFTVSASGDYVTYQWRKGGVPIDGATGASYDIASPTAADNGTYDVLVKNACQTLTSDPVTLTYSAITVTANPVNSVFSDGATAHFSAAATANPSPTVQWQRFNGSSFVDIPGANSLTLMLPVTVADNGAQFRAAFTNTCPAVFTTAAALTVRQFTDPVITMNITPVRLVHFQQIRDRIYEHRTRYAVAPALYPYTNATLVNVTVEDLVEARTALSQAYVAAGRTPPSYTNTITRNVSKISKTDVDELRAACIALE